MTHEEMKHRLLETPYYEEVPNAKEVFKADALKTLGLALHPKADILFSKCWDETQSDGYYETWKCLLSWAELLD